MDLETLAQQVINGLMLGCIYALIALGYTMVYGVLRLINFAHGDVLMLGAYTGLYVTPIVSFAAGFPAGQLMAVLVMSMVVCAAIGMVIERLAYKPVRTAPSLTALITAMGVSLLLENGGIMVFGANPRGFPRDELLPETMYQLGAGLPAISNRQVWVVGTALVLLAFLYYVVTYTRMGKAMRAVSYDRDAARLMGIHVDSVVSFTFGLGSAMAGAGGVLYSLYYGSLDPYMGIYPGLKAFVAAVLGGIGSIPGAMLGGIIMGFTEATVAYYASTWRDAMAFGVLVVILLIRPSGILGRHTVEKV
ncbi:MAG: branched-chain amino acid ABC transporter permease [Armatimonadetes bacterium]|nr:branched-chain amino acid ABC transporter permease [Armatimonadota bacterium]